MDLFQFMTREEMNENPRFGIGTVTVLQYLQQQNDPRYQSLSRLSLDKIYEEMAKPENRDLYEIYVSAIEETLKKKL